MDWFKLFFGKKPVTLEEYHKSYRTNIFLNVVWVVVIVLFLFGVMQQRAEVSSCWTELEQRRVECPSLVWNGSGLVEREGVVVCGEDFFVALDDGGS